jgi:hypothetical protein
VRDPGVAADNERRLGDQLRHPEDGREDHCFVDLGRAHRRAELRRHLLADRRRRGLDPGAAPHDDVVDAGQQPGGSGPTRPTQHHHRAGPGRHRAHRRAGHQHVASTVQPRHEDKWGFGS